VVLGCTLLVLLFIVVSNSVGCGRPPTPHVRPPEPHVRPPEPHAPRVVDNVPESRLSRPQILQDNLQQSSTRTGGPLEPQEVELINATLNVDSPQTAAKSLREFSQRGPYEWIVSYCLCACMEALSDYQDENVRWSTEAWQGCFLSIAQKAGQSWAGYEEPLALQMIEDLTTTWEWAEASPSFAAAYFRVCVIA
jgi:hypothetical protein